jgi:serine/threonine-protein kinase
MTRPSWIGQTLGGRYRIDDLLGQGGMSAVYKAYDPNLKRVVAIKLIHAHLAEDPKFVIRFEEEATAVARLRHPNIVQVFDYNHDDDLYYMVQEFVAGETLQQRLRRLSKANRRMALDEAISYMLQMCDATGYAHQRGLVHRDIKPANIMIDIHGQAILMDFGIVKITGGEKHTATGAVVGTALYLPPELIRGETPDPRSDQYSLAVTLFEAISGRPPYEADSAMTLMMMHLNDPLPDLRQLRPETPPALASVIEMALAKKREERYATMADFAAALRSALATFTAAPPEATQADQPTPPAAQPPLQPAGERTDIELLAAASAPQPAPFPEQAAIPSLSRTDKRAGAAAQPALPPEIPAVMQTLPPSRPKYRLWAGIGGAALIVVLIAIFLLRGAGGANTPPVTPRLTITATSAQAEQVILPTAAPSAISTPTETPIPPPSATPTITPSPTPTIPAGQPYARINAIRLNEQGFYVVDYETFEYTEKLPGEHVHFYFNTVAQEQAGVPGGGPWKLYGGPRPFDDYRAADRPTAATQMCIRVANSDHSILFDSGNCVILPDVNVATALLAGPCLAGPDPAHPALTQLQPGQALQVTGISPDEAWWTVSIPGQPGEACWLQRSLADFSGDLSTLPMAEVPPPPAGSAALSVQITAITLDDQGRYIVEFTPNGFTPALPGTHIHFYFDIFSADQVGISGVGNRQMFGDASPFAGYAQSDRPEGAMQMCALVANPDHSVIPGSGNCFALP